MRNTALLAATLLALACAFSSCGSSDSGSTSSASSTQASGEAESQSAGGGSKSGGKASESGGEAEATGNGGKKQGGSSGQGGGEDKKTSRAATPHGSGGGSGQKHANGGGNGAAELGSKASESELEEAAATTHIYFVARNREEWRRACSSLSKTMIVNLQRLVEDEGEEEERVSCPDAFATIAPTLPPRIAHGSTVVEAIGLSVKGQHGYLTYRSSGGVVYTIGMAREGHWKVAALAGSPQR